MRKILLALTAIVALGIFTVAFQPRGTASADGPHGDATHQPRPTRVPATATPIPATPVVVTTTTTIMCEGPFSAATAYGTPYYQGPYAGAYPTFSGLGFVNYNGFAIPPYNGAYGWTQPMLVTRVNGVITQALPNTSVCAATVAPPTSVPAPPVVVQVQSPQAPAAPTAPLVAPSLPAAPYSFVRPPNTGDAGLASP